MNDYKPAIQIPKSQGIIPSYWTTIDPMRFTQTQNQLLGALVAAIFGLGLFTVGGRLIIYEHLLTDPAKTTGSIVSSGSTRSSRGGYVSYVRYKFLDHSGIYHSGIGNGYSGKTGELILIEYSSRFPYIHRVAGEGKNTGYEWRWYIFCTGIFFFIVGVHWGWSIQKMTQDERDRIQ
ncbi:MAG: hypothetical protein HC918_07330 [Oscillatoriales cyanobacterium SM2_1_8]|nr:hypothetical protein [Oscillatoriales cyanobacterium SM2_1_8]